MCGIVGFIDRNCLADVVQEMLDIQSYRGPDDSGIYFDTDSGVHLGHNRLSIQDLTSQGHQPFISDCGNYVLSYNGEVYNFNSIKSELLDLGYKFRSNSDTEVVLYSYIEWGIDCLHRFIGMFAFSIFDKLRNKLFLVRDRAGVKPLYYYYSGGQFIFSSELKSLSKHPSFNKLENIDVLPYFFQFGYIPAPYTIFLDCFKLEAGQYLEFDIDDFNFQIFSYWNVWEHYINDKFDSDEIKITKELEAILDDAIGLRMVSDVPVGIFLSGGYDSSLVSAILAKKQGREINTFTIGFDDDKYNEASHAKEIAKYLGAKHTEHYISECEILELVNQLPFYFDEPFGDSSAIPTMIVSKIAKDKVNVVLSSDGGDEAFCGYSKYFFLDKFSSIFSNKFKRFALRKILNLSPPHYVEYLNEKLPQRYRQSNFAGKYTKFVRALDSNDLLHAFQQASSYVDTRDVSKFLKLSTNDTIYEKWDVNDNVNFLEQMMALDYSLFMSDDVLTKVDRSTMFTSLEGREPLLDHRIIEFMARVPRDIKYKEGHGKYLLRKVLYRYLPQDLVDKPKAGFQVPLDEWLRGVLKPLVLTYLSPDKLDTKLFDSAAVEKIKSDFFSGSALGTPIWFILMYQMWKEKWLE